MKQLYFLLILTLSFGVYSQTQTKGSILTFNFDTKEDGSFITGYEAKETTYTGSKAQVGYVGVLGDADPNNSGAIKCPKSTGASSLPIPTGKNQGKTNYYSARYPNTNLIDHDNDVDTPNQPKSPGLNVSTASKVHFSVAFKGWKITDNSGNNFHFRLKTADNKVIASIKLEQSQNSTGPVSNQVRIVGNIWNNNANGTTKNAGHFGTGSGTSTTPVNIGITIDYLQNTWAFWTDNPGNTEGFTYNYGQISGTLGGSDTKTTSVTTSPPIVDHMQFVWTRPAGGSASQEGTVGTEDYIILDQIKVHQGNYVNTLSIDDFADDNSFNIYPNPADNFVVLQNAKVGDKLDLFDVVGKKVKSFQVESESQQLDISELKTGVYFARSNQLEAIKIIKK